MLLARIIGGMLAFGKYVVGVEGLLGGHPKTQSALGEVAKATDTLVSVFGHVLYIDAALKDTAHTVEERTAMIAPLVAKDLQLMPALSGHKLKDAGKLTQAATLMIQAGRLALEAYDDGGAEVKDIA